MGLFDFRLRANRVISALALARPGTSLEATDELQFANASPSGNLVVELAATSLPIDFTPGIFNLAPGASFKVDLEVFSGSEIAFQILFNPTVAGDVFTLDYYEAADFVSLDIPNLCYHATLTSLDPTPVT